MCHPCYCLKRPWGQLQVGGIKRAWQKPATVLCLEKRRTEWPFLSASGAWEQSFAKMRIERNPWNGLLEQFFTQTLFKARSHRQINISDLQSLLRDIWSTPHLPNCWIKSFLCQMPNLHPLHHLQPCGDWWKDRRRGWMSRGQYTEGEETNIMVQGELVQDEGWLWRYDLFKMLFYPSD